MNLLESSKVLLPSFHMKDLGRLSYFLGLERTTTKNAIFITQDLLDGGFIRFSNSLGFRMSSVLGGM